MEPITLKRFRKAKPRDFTNGALLGEIEAALEQRELLLQLIAELDVEMDGVRCPFTADAILNRFRSILNELE